MSALGQKRTFCDAGAMSALPKSGHQRQPSPQSAPRRANAAGLLPHSSIRLPCLYYFFLAVVVIRYEPSRRASAPLFIVRAFFDDTITIAVWTGFMLAPHGMLHTDAILFAGASLIRLRPKATNIVW